MSDRTTRFGTLVIVVTAFFLIPLCLGIAGRFVMIASVHFGAWLAGVVDRWGDTVGRLGMILGTGLMMLVGYALLVGFGLLVAVALGVLVDRTGLWIMAHLGRR